MPRKPPPPLPSKSNLIARVESISYRFQWLRPQLDSILTEWKSHYPTRDDDKKVLTKLNRIRLELDRLEMRLRKGPRTRQGSHR